MGSTRFPGKSLSVVWQEATLLELVVRRMMKSGRLDSVVLATSDLPRDEPLERLGRNLGVTVVRGSESDVLTRFVKVMSLSPSDAIVRVCGDNPLVDPQQIDALVDFFWDNQPSHYACNDKMGCGLPDGAGAEIMSAEGLNRLDQMVHGDMREHVSMYATMHPEFFGVKRLEAQGRLRRPEIRLDVDYPEDVDFVRELIRVMGARKSPFWNTSDAIRAIDREPGLIRLRKDRSESTVPTAD